jgi:hypothetical protein
MTDKVAEFDDEHDPYLEHLAKLGRSEDDDLRSAITKAVTRLPRACSGTRLAARPSIQTRTANMVALSGGHAIAWPLVRVTAPTTCLSFATICALSYRKTANLALMRPTCICTRSIGTVRQRC